MDEPLPCVHDCRMKIDMLNSDDVFSFLEENGLVFEPIEHIASFSKRDLHCSLCVIDTILNRVVEKTFSCSHERIIHLLRVRLYLVMLSHARLEVQVER